MLPNIFFLKDICINNTKKAKNGHKKIESKITLPPPPKPLCSDGYQSPVVDGVDVDVDELDAEREALAHCHPIHLV